MTTVMETALKAAGVPLRSIPERIWYYVKDHPGSTCHDIQAVLHLPFDRVATVCGTLVKRKMFYVKKETRRVHGTRGGVRMVNLYTAPPTMGVYTVLPMPSSKPAASPAPAKLPAPPLQVVPPTLASPEQKSKFDLDNMTVGEAKLLYERLHRMFGKSAT